MAPDTHIEWDAFKAVLHAYAFKTEYGAKLVLLQELLSLETDIQRYERTMPEDQKAAAPLTQTRLVYRTALN
ncbi:hypothetical protein NDU88_001054 [Pleurodeles waltl]|uniref:Uncharacterized protein n=1 Tax=Pleurodeles waltl TaxID=8319 RepID=A0AAV7P7L8_PLEWA|nr:hypothetical protein NDU88_001054 [Pleurodeles waltl]